VVEFLSRLTGGLSKQIWRWVAGTILCLLPTLALAQTTNVTTSDSGWYRNDGFHGSNNQNYYTGSHSSGQLRGFFTFNIPSSSVAFTSARLRFFTYGVFTGPNTLDVYDVSTAISSLVAGGSGLTATYADLGSGTMYASTLVAAPNTFIEIPLNAAALSAINARRGSSFAVGFRNRNISATPDSIFSSSNFNSGNRLVLTRPPADTTPPVVTPPPAVTVEATGATTAVALGTATANDNVDGALTPTASPTGPFTVGVHTVTWSATDAAGNPGTATQTVTVTDTTPPTVTAPADVTVEATGPMTAVTLGTASATDLVDGSITPTPDTTGPFAVGAHTVTWSATDAKSNTGTATQTVTVQDTTAPAITVPADITAEATSASGATVNYTAPTATDAVGVTSLVSSPASGSTFAIGTTIVTVTAKDAAGNTSQETFSVTVKDTTAPVITAPADITAEATSSAGAAVSFTPTATDAVGVTSLTSSPASGSIFAIGTTPVTITAVDAAGNSSQATFNVSVEDTTPPVITAPANIVTNTDPASATAVVAFTPTAADAVGVTSLTSSPASGSAFAIGTTTVTITAKDAAGNTSTETFTVTVNDNEVPVITVPADIVVNTDPGQPTAVVTFTPTAADNDGVASLTSAPASGSAFPIGTTVVTVTATDNSGNSAQKSFNVTVNDNEAPVISVPADIVVNTDPGQPTAVVTFTPTATDNDGVASLVSSPASGSAFAIGTTLVTVTATDNSGNQSTATFNVTANDNEPPVITVPADIVVNTDPGLPTAVVSFTPTATDNDGVASLTSSPASGTAFAIGTTTVTVTATDNSGNSASETFTVTVNDNEPPVIVGLPSDIVVSVNYPDTSAVVSYTPPTVTDNAPGASISRTGGLASGAAFPLSTTVVTYTATDAAGNSVSASFNVTVNQIPPGQVTIAVVSDVADGTFNFSSSQSQFNFAVTTSGGTGQSTPVLIKPGTYVVTASLPAGFGLVSGNCTDGDSTVVVATKTATINLQSSEKVTCTFISADSRTKTAQTIARFLKRRNDLLLQSEPDADRQIARLNAASGGASGGSNGGGAPPSNLGGPTGSASAGGGASGVNGGTASSHGAQGTSRLSGFAATGSIESSRAPLTKSQGGNGLHGLSVQARGGNSVHVAASMAQSHQGNRAAEKQRLRQLLGEKAYSRLGAGKLVDKQWRPWSFDIWAEGRIAYFKDESGSGETDGHFGVFYIGADYVVNPWLLVGALVQYDDMKESSITEATRVHGRGWMAGPYATVKLSDNLYFQTRAAWGQSQNDISPFLTYTDTFDTTRWLVRGKLKGVWNFGALRFSPSASVAYIEEHQKSYVDSLNVLIPSQTVSLGQFEFGPEISYTIKQANGTTIVPSFALKGIWNFAESNGAALAGTAAGSAEFRGKAEAGVRFADLGGVSFEFSGAYDGIGDNDYQAVSGRARIVVPLQR
jgi:Autotransporter beta-domain/HYR domain